MIVNETVLREYDEYLRDKYLNLKVVDTRLDAKNPVHIPPTFFDAKSNIRTKEDLTNVPDFSKCPDKKTRILSEMTAILKFDTNRKDRKFILIEGAPGCGKSTTARYLCRLWAEKEFGQEYKLFILIEFRMLKNTDCHDIRDLIRFACPEKIKEAAKKEISAHNGRKILFLFEGWDECPQNCAIVHKIIDGQELPASSIIITSRYNSAGELYEKIDRRIELAPFTPSNRVTYIEKYFQKDNDSEKKADSLIFLLSDHPDLESLCSNPMILCMACYTHLKDNCKAFSATTEVYDQFICLVVNRYLREKQGLTKTLVGKALDVFKHASLSAFQQYTKLALHGVQTQIFVFEENDLRDWGIDPLGDCKESAGIVLKYTQSNIVDFESTSYQFLHDSVQCFFAALEMSQCNAEEQSQIVKNYIESLFAVCEHSTKGDEYLGQLDDHRYKQQYSEELDSVQKYEPKLSDPQPLLLQFFAGITRLNNPAIVSALIEESKKGAHDQWCKSALPLILYESQNKELTKNVMREVLKPQLVVSCQDNFHLRCTAWCMAQAERKVEELTIILREHIRLKYFFGICDDLSSLKTLNIRGSVCTSGE